MKNSDNSNPPSFISFNPITRAIYLKPSGPKDVGIYDLMVLANNVGPSSFSIKFKVYVTTNALLSLANTAPYFETQPQSSINV